MSNTTKTILNMIKGRWFSIGQVLLKVGSKEGENLQGNRYILIIQKHK